MNNIIIQYIINFIIVTYDFDNGLKFE
jgi:hypothetical protein